MLRLTRHLCGDLRRSRSWRIVAPIGAVAVVLVAASIARHRGGPDAWTSLTSAAQPRSASDSSLPVFRLGDAATPFGWATTLGDFNTDGTPDVAVADRIAQWAGGYAYRLEFEISGQAPDDVTFESQQAAITVSVADVDRDNDLDIIVATPISGETVGIWLNDGTGHFTAGEMRPRRSSVGSEQSLDVTGRALGLLASESSPRRADDGLAASVREALQTSDIPIRAQRATTFRPVPLSSRARPRAPPSISRAT
jgi:hypothetical protein